MLGAPDLDIDRMHLAGLGVQSQSVEARRYSSYAGGPCTLHT